MSLSCALTPSTSLESCRATAAAAACNIGGTAAPAAGTPSSVDDSRLCSTVVRWLVLPRRNVSPPSLLLLLVSVSASTSTSSVLSVVVLLVLSELSVLAPSPLSMAARYAANSLARATGFDGGAGALGDGVKADEADEADEADAGPPHAAAAAATDPVGEVVVDDVVVDDDAGGVGGGALFAKRVFGLVGEVDGVVDDDVIVGGGAVAAVGVDAEGPAAPNTGLAPGRLGLGPGRPGFVGVVVPAARAVFGDTAIDGAAGDDVDDEDGAGTTEPAGLGPPAALALLADVDGEPVFHEGGADARMGLGDALGEGLGEGLGESLGEGLGDSLGFGEDRGDARGEGCGDVVADLVISVDVRLADSI